jgi:hypothetical protein
MTIVLGVFASTARIKRASDRGVRCAFKSQECGAGGASEPPTRVSKKNAQRPGSYLLARSSCTTSNFCFRLRGLPELSKTNLLAEIPLCSK